MSEWLSDLRWALNMMRARKFRRNLYFSDRGKFDEALRSKPNNGFVISYPDAFYHTKIDDLLRAIQVTTPTTGRGE